MSSYVSNSIVEYSSLDKYYFSCMIVKKNGTYQVRSMKGKVLGTHQTLEKAKRQLRAIEASKAKKG